MNEATFEHWKSTVAGLIPVVPYVLKAFGLWPAVIPLPPIEQVWPVIAGSMGLGVVSKDYDK